MSLSNGEAPRSNPVLSLSKHVWSLRLALRRAQGAIASALTVDRHHE
jgi:hypothetical protein